MLTANTALKHSVACVYELNVNKRPPKVIIIIIALKFFFSAKPWSFYFLENTAHIWARSPLCIFIAENLELGREMEGLIVVCGGGRVKFEVAPQ